MKFTAALVALATLVLPAVAQSGNVVVTYDNTYDNPNYPLSGTACSNGANGLQSKFPTLGKIPNFPNVGGIPGLTWNSPLCGTCWQLTYTNPSGKSTSINITAVDEAFSYNLSLEAMNALTGGTAQQLGSVKAVAKSLPPSSCGM